MFEILSVSRGCVSWIIDAVWDSWRNGEIHTKYQIESNISAAHGIVRSKGHILNFNIHCPHFHISYNLQCKMPALPNFFIKIEIESTRKSPCKDYWFGSPVLCRLCMRRIHYFPSLLATVWYSVWHFHYLSLPLGTRVARKFHWGHQRWAAWNSTFCEHYIRLINYGGKVREGMDK